MFSETGIAQEIAALLVAALAFVYLVHKIGGWPRLAKKPKPPVVVGGRLARGLRAASHRRDESHPAR